MTQDEPLISVIMPAWNSSGTLAGNLAALRAQSYSNVEVIIVDSSPLGPGEEDRAAAIVQRELPAARYLHVNRRLTPHAARNVGAAHACGDLFAFTDPDIYPRPDWLAQLLAVFRQRGGAVVGTLACFGARWQDRGVHLAKFHLALAPAHASAHVRQIGQGWSGNLLLERATFYALGGWPRESFQGDTVFTVALVRAGVPLWLAPEAVVEHDHEGVRLGSFVRVRFYLGREFLHLEAAGLVDGRAWKPHQVRAQAMMLPLLPLKIAVSSARVVDDARRAGLLGTALWTLPSIVAGRGAWLAGRALGVIDLWRAGR